MSSDAGSATPVTSAESKKETQSASKRQKKSLGSFFKQPAAEMTSLSETEKIKAELNNYLHGPLADGESNPLKWWTIHEVNFPNISHLAKKYLCILKYTLRKSVQHCWKCSDMPKVSSETSYSEHVGLFDQKS